MSFFGGMAGLLTRVIFLPLSMGSHHLPRVHVNKPVDQAPVVQTSDTAIHRINHYPADRVIDFLNTYLLDSDLSGG